MNTNNPGIYRVQNIPWQAKLQGTKLATFKSRLLAFLLDLSAVGAILLAASMWASPKNVSMGEELTISLEVSGLLAFATFVAYFAISTFIGRGATIGKRLAGIQVVSLVHDHLSLWHCIERTLGYSASSLEVGFGFLQFFTHPNRQTVHDRIAETIVVERSKRVRKLVKTIDAK